MKALKAIGVTVFVAFVMTLPVWAGVGLTAIAGSSTGDLESLRVWGSEVTCEWVSPRGDEAIFRTPGGRRRFVDLTVRPLHVEAGKQYRLKATVLPKWGSRLYLVPA